MSQPLHTPGPLEFLELGRTEEAHNRCKPLTLCEAREKGDDVANVYSSDDSTVYIPRHQAVANTRLLAAAYNAFDSAGKKLGVNAVELAERMQDGGIAELVIALEMALPFVQPPVELIPTCVRGNHASMAHSKATTALAKVKGGAS